MRRWWLTVLGLLLLASSSPARAAGCEVFDRLEGRVLPDEDCDILPDAFDNCPSRPNPDQDDRNSNSVGDACEQEAKPAPEPRAGFTVEYVQARDLEPGRGTFFPLRLQNLGLEPLALSISASMAPGWGTYRVEPPAPIPPGQTGQAFVYIYANPDTVPGAYDVAATITDGRTTREAKMTARVLRQAGAGMPDWAWPVLALLVLLIVASLLIAFDYRRSTRKPPSWSPPYSFE